MSKQVLSIEQMQHLKELGVDTSKANFYWHRTKSLNNYNEWDEWKLYYGALKLIHRFTAIDCEYVRTFTLQDILDLLPKTINKEEILIGWSQKGGWCIGYFGISPTIRNEHLIEAAYEMLCWCAKSGYIKDLIPNVEG